MKMGSYWKMFNRTGRDVSRPVIICILFFLDYTKTLLPSFFFLKLFIEFVTILLLFYVLVFWPRGMWDLSFPVRDQTLTPCIGR